MFNWAKVCLEKKRGCLGVRVLSNVNRVLFYVSAIRRWGCFSLLFVKRMFFPFLEDKFLAEAKGRHFSMKLVYQIMNGGAASPLPWVLKKVGPSILTLFLCG